MSSAASMASMPGPSDVDYRSVTRFFKNFAPIARSEEYYAEQHRKDLVALRPAEDTSRMDEILLRFLVGNSNRWVQVNRNGRPPSILDILTHGTEGIHRQSKC